MSDYTEKNSNLIPQIDIPCFAWNSQAEQGFLFFKAKSLYTIWTRRRRLVTVRRQVNGIASDTDTPFHQLLSCADEQMYLAKQRLKAKNKPSDK